MNKRLCYIAPPLKVISKLGCYWSSHSTAVALTCPSRSVDPHNALLEFFWFEYWHLQAPRLMCKCATDAKAVDVVPGRSSVQFLRSGLCQASVLVQTLSPPELACEYCHT